MLATVEKILASSQFCNSKRYPGFLRYVVDQTLNGNIDLIKERTVGIEVFGRAPDYDTSADTVVRYTAGEVRKRLALYYQHAPDALILIALSPRSYQPEFFRIVEDGTAPAEVVEMCDPPAASADEPHEELVSLHSRLSVRQGAVYLALVLLGASLVWAGEWVRDKYFVSSVDRFWAPITQAKGPVLVCPGGTVFSPTTATHHDVAGYDSENPYLSYENALALSRTTALLSTKGIDYRIQPSATLTLAELREYPVVLIGAYNNMWTERLLRPLRFHFADRSGMAIVDASHPEVKWERDPAKPFSDSTDYGLVARFRNPTSDSMVFVEAGLERYGTDAASQFAASSHFLDLIYQQARSDWASKNIEVVLRVDVVQGRAGVPIIEKVYVW